MATLADIKTKVRRIIKAPSTSQITEAELLSYINNFLIYDMPENLRLFTFKKTLTFYTTPYIDIYETTSGPGAPIREEDPLYNFKNAYITESTPIFCDGTKIYLSQSRDEFYSMYPPTQQRIQIATGDGATVLYADTLSSAPVVPYSVLFSSYDANGEQLVITDVPQRSATTGQFLIGGDLVWPEGAAAYGSINYKTGVYSFTFPQAPDAEAKIYAHAIPSTLGKPQSVLYYENKFVLRPVPDAVYSITMDAYVRPDALENDADYPELEQHWSYIAWGAAKRILEDRVDTDTLAQIMPMFKEQENLVQRRTLVQNQEKEAATIYNTKTPNRWWGNGFY